MQNKGVLAIWNNVVAGRESEFEDWFQGEHLAERLAVPGFVYGRRHRAISGRDGYFNFYLTQSPAVLTAPPYLERVNNPTPMTRRIMSEVFIDMSRTVCSRVYRHSMFRGTFAVTARFDTLPERAELQNDVRQLCADPTKVANGEIWIASDHDLAPISTEESLRGGDRHIAGCLMVDTLREADAILIAAALRQRFPHAEIGVFEMLCQVGRSDL